MTEIYLQIAFDKFKENNVAFFEKLKTPISIIELSCEIVEEMSKKYKLSSGTKQQLAGKLAQQITNYLTNLNMISAKLNSTITQLTQSGDIFMFIDDIIDIWNSHKKENIIASLLCCCFKKCKKLNDNSNQSGTYI